MKKKNGSQTLGPADQQTASREQTIVALLGGAAQQDLQQAERRRQKALKHATLGLLSGRGWGEFVGKNRARCGENGDTGWRMPGGG